MARQRVRREDVARAAGVSGATVSYVLNGRAAEMRLSPETAARVQRVAAELGYLPHGAARELRRGRTDRVAAVMWLGHRTFWAPMLEAMHRQAHARGLDVLVCFRERDEPLHEVVLPAMEQVDGAVVIAGAMPEAEVEGCRDTAKPLVLVNHWALPGFSTVVTPAGELLELTTGHLLEQGWDDLLLSIGLPHFVIGFEAALHARGRRLEPGMVRPTGTTYEAGARLAATLGDDVRGRALVTAADVTAMGAMAEFEKRGLRAGRDYAITGLHNHDAGPWLSVPLTTAHRPYELIAEQSLDLLCGSGEVSETVVPGKLIVRASSLRPAD